MLVSCQNISKVYGNGSSAVLAVDNVSLDIERGESVSLMGKSGCGKTTLLNLLAVIDQPDHGEYWFEGQNVLQLSNRELLEFRRQKVSVIFQSFNLINELTAKENILLPLTFSREKVKKDVFDDLVTRLGIASRLQHLPAQLSGGEQQRVAIARAILMDPVLILADEPTGNLDSHNGNEVSNLLIESCKMYEKTLFLVTHEHELAMKTDRVIYMQDGRITNSELP